MSLDLDILEAHGLSNGSDEVRIHITEHLTGCIFIKTTGYEGRKLTAAEARYVASRLLRLAWRSDARATQTTNIEEDKAMPLTVVG